MKVKILLPLVPHTSGTLGHDADGDDPGDYRMRNAVMHIINPYSSTLSIAIFTNLRNVDRDT